MERKQREALLKVMKVLTAGYPKMEIKEETIEAYLMMFEDLPIEAVQGAILEHMADNIWFPSIAEIRSLALDRLPDRRIPSGAQAWEEVRRALKDFYPGVNNKPFDYSHDVVRRGVEAMGGLYNLSMSENSVADRAHFLKLYEQFREQAVREALQIPQVKELRERLKMPVLRLKGMK